MPLWRVAAAQGVRIGNDTGRLGFRYKQKVNMELLTSTRQKPARPYQVPTPDITLHLQVACVVAHAGMSTA